MCNVPVRSWCTFFSVEAMVRGYHEYQKVWNALIGEILSCEREVGSIHDTFAVAIIKYG